MKVCSLRFHWKGRLPQVGHFLKTRTGKTAYEITCITVTDRGYVKRGTFRCARWPACDLPEGVTVHRWNWDTRARKRCV